MPDRYWFTAQIGIDAKNEHIAQRDLIDWQNAVDGLPDGDDEVPVVTLVVQLAPDGITPGRFVGE